MKETMNVKTISAVNTKLGSLLRSRKAKSSEDPTPAERRPQARHRATPTVTSDVGMTVPYRDAPR